VDPELPEIKPLQLPARLVIRDRVGVDGTIPCSTSSVPALGAIGNADEDELFTLSAACV